MVISGVMLFVLGMLAFALAGPLLALGIAALFGIFGPILIGVAGGVLLLGGIAFGLFMLGVI